MTSVTLPRPVSRPAGGRHPLGRPPAAATTAATAAPSAASRAEPAEPTEPLPAEVLADIVTGIAAATPLWSQAVLHV